MADDIRIGDRVRVWMGTPARGAWERGTVVGVNTRGLPGVEIKFDRCVNGVATCYATHSETVLVEQDGDDR